MRLCDLPKEEPGNEITRFLKPLHSSGTFAKSIFKVNCCYPTYKLNKYQHYLPLDHRVIQQKQTAQLCLGYALVTGLELVALAIESHRAIEAMMRL